LYSCPSPTCRKIQLFLWNLDVLYREHILTPLVPNLFISNHSKHEFLCQYLTVISKIFFLKFPSKFHSISSLPRKITYIKRVLRQKRSQIRLFRCRYFFPMPQLTPDCDRVVVFSFPPLDGMDFNALYMVKLLQMVMEIRISEDYFLSDIIVADYCNATLRHMTKITPSLVKKYEMCALVSNTNIFYVNNDNRA